MLGMLEEAATRRVNSARQPTDLLREAFSRHGLGDPVLESVSPESIPEPYRQLLVHDSDMTSTLKRFHGDSLVLKRLHVEADDEEVRREVLLRTKHSDKAVEYGVIRIRLKPFAKEAREAIQAGVIPLGQILDDFEVPYSSRPSDYFRIASQPYLDGLLGDVGGVTRFGRMNSLSERSGALLAEVIEILPVSKFDSQN